MVAETESVPDRRRVLAGVMAGLAMASTVSGRDEKSRPAVSRRFSSPSGGFQLDVTGPEGWKTSQALAEMFAVDASGRRRVWSRPLPQRYGPALAMVADNGAALLVDEWIKTPSPHALVVLAPGGQTIGTYSMTDIAVASGIPAAQLSASASAGPWMSAPPTLAAQRLAVLIEAGGVRLEVDLRTATLARVSAGP